MIYIYMYVCIYVFMYVCLIIIDSKSVLALDD